MSDATSSVQSSLAGKLAVRAIEIIRANEAELTKLDQAIGDGDHGINLSRGFGAVAEIADELGAMDFGAALSKAGMTLVMKVGGASGPLYGSALMAMGKATTSVPDSAEEVADMLDTGIGAIMQRGRSDLGAKTMLDVLGPVRDAARSGADIPEIRRVADDALEATRDMLATKGRAAFLGERSVGHLDPGARSSCLLVHMVCDILEES